MARKILLADDSVTAQNMGRRILSDAGYEVITVNNGSAALKKIAELTPDLIVLDVYMPGYGGLEVCQRLKESQATSRIPVLLTVGKLEPFKADEARRVRADGHIIKPFDANELLAAIMRLEDRIVPQPASTKTGRFAKAIASVEDTASRRKREKSSDPAGETTSGWKRRLSIPRNAPPEEVAKESAQQSTGTSFYDLGPRTESKPAEAKLPETAASSRGAQDSSITEESATPAASFQKSVEIEPVSKSAPDVQDVPADLQPEPQAKVEAITAEMPVADQPSSTTAHVAGSDQSADGAEVMAAIASLSPAAEVSETVKSPSRDGDTPIGALATAIAAVSAVFKGPRWVADPVPLSDGDSHLLLELEMEKAYAAFAAAESARNPLPELAPEADTQQIETAIVMAPPQSSAESRLSWVSDREQAISNPESKDIAASEGSDSSLASEPVFTSATEPEEQTTNLVATPMVQPSSAETEADAPAEPAASIGFRDIAYAAAASASSAASEPNRGTVISSGSEFSASQVEAATKAADEVPVQPESTASQTAADATSSPASSATLSGSQEAQLASAWQNWRQIRESIIGQQLPSQVADAATAAFKQIREERTAETADKESESTPQNRAAVEASTIAGIVDSVLSELKPKLMEEIAKKLAEDRK